MTGPARSSRRSRLRRTLAFDEKGASVVLQFGHTVANVRQGPVQETLLRLALIDPWVPALRELLDRGHVDHPVVQMRVEEGHVAGEEAAVGGNRVPAQR